MCGDNDELTVMLSPDRKRIAPVEARKDDVVVVVEEAAAADRDAKRRNNTVWRCVKSRE